MWGVGEARVWGVGTLYVFRCRHQLFVSCILLSIDQLCSIERLPASCHVVLWIPFITIVVDSSANSQTLRYMDIAKVCLLYTLVFTSIVVNEECSCRERLHIMYRTQKSNLFIPAFK